VEVECRHCVESALQPEATQPRRVKYPGGDEQNIVDQWDGSSLSGWHFTESVFNNRRNKIGELLIYWS
jgi:hypothetical protein